MAAPPALRALDVESFPGASDELGRFLEQLAAAVNPFLAATSDALTGKLTLAENFLCVTKTVTAAVPAQTWLSPTLLNAWVAYGASRNTAGYRIDASGRVFLRGALKNGVAAAGTVLFTLPAGYRPSLEEVFAVSSNGAFGEALVQADGDVCIGGAGSNTSFSLDGISFNATQPAAPPAFGTPGWPLAVTTGLLGAPTHVLATRIDDVTTASTFTVGAASLDWAPGAKDSVSIKSITGLTPGRTYRITLLIIAS